MGDRIEIIAEHDYISVVVLHFEDGLDIRDDRRLDDVQVAIVIELAHGNRAWIVNVGAVDRWLERSVAITEQKAQAGAVGRDGVEAAGRILIEIADRDSLRARIGSKRCGWAECAVTMAHEQTDVGAVAVRGN